jgi:plastocyanin
MVQTANGAMEFQPKDITIGPGDAIKWVVVSGPPHNVAFNPDEVVAAARAQLQANMDNPPAELNSPMLLNIGDEFTMSFANVPSGTYSYICTPHLAMGMTGTITIR